MPPSHTPSFSMRPRLSAPAPPLPSLRKASIRGHTYTPRLSMRPHCLRPTVPRTPAGRSTIPRYLYKAHRKKTYPRRETPRALRKYLPLFPRERTPRRLFRGIRRPPKSGPPCAPRVRPFHAPAPVRRPCLHCLPCGSLHPRAHLQPSSFHTVASARARPSRAPRKRPSLFPTRENPAALVSGCPPPPEKQLSMRTARQVLFHAAAPLSAARASVALLAESLHPRACLRPSSFYTAAPVQRPTIPRPAETPLLFPMRTARQILFMRPHLSAARPSRAPAGRTAIPRAPLQNPPQNTSRTPFSIPQPPRGTFPFQKIQNKATKYENRVDIFKRFRYNKRKRGRLRVASTTALHKKVWKHSLIQPDNRHPVDSITDFRRDCKRIRKIRGFIVAPFSGEGPCRDAVGCVPRDGFFVFVR